MPRYVNSLGLVQTIGPRESSPGLPTTVETYGHIRQFVLTFDYLDANDNLPRINANVDDACIRIPANSYIRSAYLHVQEAFASGGSAVLNLGSIDVDGTADDPDGIDAVALAALTENAWVQCDGALINASSGDEDITLSVVADTADFTAGKAVLLLEVILPYIAEAPLYPESIND